MSISESIIELITEASGDMTIKKGDISKLVKDALNGGFLELGGPWNLAYLTKGKSVVIFNNMSQAIDPTSPKDVERLLNEYILIRDARDKTKLKNKPILGASSSWYIDNGRTRYFYYSDTNEWGVTGKANIPNELYKSLEDAIAGG